MLSNYANFACLALPTCCLYDDPAELQGRLSKGDVKSSLVGVVWILLGGAAVQDCASAPGQCDRAWRILPTTRVYYGRFNVVSFKLGCGYSVSTDSFILFVLLSLLLSVQIARRYVVQLACVMAVFMFLALSPMVFLLTLSCHSSWQCD